MHCAFTVQKSTYTKNKSSINHKCVFNRLENFSFTNQNKNEIVKDELSDAVVRFVGVQNLSFRGMCSEELNSLITISYKLGQQNPDTDITQIYQPLTEKSAKKKFISTTIKKQNQIMEKYRKIASCALALDAGKLKSKSYLEFLLVSAIDNLPPLPIYSVSHFNGTTEKYRETVLGILTDLFSKGISIYTIVSDNLGVQKSAIDGKTDASFQYHTEDNRIRVIKWISCFCHSLALAINDYRKIDPIFDEYVNSIIHLGTYLRSKPVFAEIKIVCPGYSNTRWTGIFDLVEWIFNHQELINRHFHSALESPKLRENLDKTLFHAANDYAVILYLVLVAYKFASLQGESDSTSVGYSYPLLAEAAAYSYSITEGNAIAFKLATGLRKAVKTRLENTLDGRFLQFLYNLTYEGRINARVFILDNVTLEDYELINEPPKFLNITDKLQKLINKVKSSYPDAASEALYLSHMLEHRDSSRGKAEPVRQIPDKASIIYDDIASSDSSEFVPSDDEPDIDFLPEAASDEDSLDHDSGDEDQSAGNMEDDARNHSLIIDSPETIPQELVDEWLTPLVTERTSGIIEDGTKYLESICDNAGCEKDLKQLICNQWTTWMLQPLPRTILLGRDKSVKMWDVLRNIEGYNRLAEFARGLLACPASEAAVERWFSAKRRAIQDQRSRMNSETLQCKSLWLSGLFKE